MFKMSSKIHNMMIIKDKYKNYQNKFKPKKNK